VWGVAWECGSTPRGGEGVFEACFERLWFAEPRWENAECQHDQDTDGGIEHKRQPFAFVKDNPVQKTADESCVGTGLTGQIPQLSLPHGERALKTVEELKGDNQHRCQMHAAKPGIARPGLAERQSHENGEFSQDYKTDVGDMERHDRIGPEEVPVHICLSFETNDTALRSYSHLPA
jgi:hypothetical protein